MNYTVCDTNQLFEILENELCCEFSFPGESKNQMVANSADKIAYANEHGCPIEELATLIWGLNLNDAICRRDILEKLSEVADSFKKWNYT